MATRAKKVTSEKATRKKSEQVRVVVEAPNIQQAAFKIRGTAPYVQNKFSKKAREQMRSAQAEGTKQRKKRSAKSPKDFKAIYQQAMHKTSSGWYGIPASGFRNALIRACSLTGLAMTRAKIGIWVLADGVDADDASPLVKMRKGTPSYFESAVRNESGVCDIRPRALWKPGWEATVVIEFDADMFTVDDVANLLMRAGVQVGIGEGRNDSKRSAGMGWGKFTVLGKASK